MQHHQEEAEQKAVNPGHPVHYCKKCNSYLKSKEILNNE